MHQCDARQLHKHAQLRVEEGAVAGAAGVPEVLDGYSLAISSNPRLSRYGGTGE